MWKFLSRRSANTFLNVDSLEGEQGLGGWGRGVERLGSLYVPYAIVELKHRAAYKAAPNIIRALITSPTDTLIRIYV